MSTTQTKIISRACDLNVNGFMRCAFDSDFSVLGTGTDEELQEAWQSIFTEYIDLTGANIEELPLLRRINYLEVRNKQIAIWLWLQKESIDKIAQPFFPAIADLHKHGYRLKWNNDIEDFKAQITRAETAEKRKHVELKELELQLEQHRAKQDEKPTIKNSRVAFLDVLNEVEKFGYRIDFETTSIERVALMINRWRVVQETIRKQ